MNEEKLRKLEKIIKEMLKMDLNRSEMASFIITLLTLKYGESMDTIAILEASKLAIHSERFEKVKKTIGEKYA